MVVIPRLHGKKYCPVRCLIKYLKLRNSLIQDEEVSNNLPLLLTESLWAPGAHKADKSQPGFYTKSRFSKDTVAAIKILTVHIPSVAAFTATLKTHSLRAGIPTALQKFKNIPQDLQKSIGKITRVHPNILHHTLKFFLLGRWHSSASDIY